MIHTLLVYKITIKISIEHELNELTNINQNKTKPSNISKLTNINQSNCFTPHHNYTSG